MRIRLAALSALMLTLNACSSPPAVVSTACAWVAPIYPPEAERGVLLRQAPVTAREIARLNAAYEAACSAPSR